MPTITINFSTKSARERKEEIRVTLTDKQGYPEITNAILFKQGYPDMEYGFGDEDLEFADGIRIMLS